MATLWITGYREISGFEMTGGGGVPVPSEPADWSDTVTFTTSTASDAIPRGIRFLRVMADADSHIKIGTSPVATTADQKLIADVAEWRGKRAVDGLKIAAVAAA